MRYVLAAAAFLLAPAGTPAAAELVTAKDPRKIAALLTERGYKAELIDTKDGTYIRSADSGVPVSIFFLNCSNKTDCTTIQFYTGFSDLGTVSLSTINSWNREHRFARAYIDVEGDPVIEMDVDMDANGLDRANFYSNFDIFLASIPQFREHLAKQ